MWLYIHEYVVSYWDSPKTAVEYPARLFWKVAPSNWVPSLIGKTVGLRTYIEPSTMICLWLLKRSMGYISRIAFHAVSQMTQMRPLKSASELWWDYIACRYKIALTLIASLDFLLRGVGVENPQPWASQPSIGDLSIRRSRRLYDFTMASGWRCLELFEGQDEDRWTLSMGGRNPRTSYLPMGT